MKLIMTKGLPGSGKSTWAKKQNAYRINKDDLRSMMNNGIWSKINEKYILVVRDNIIKLHLGDKNDVIVDDTNLAPKHQARLEQLAKEFGADFEIKDFTDVPLEECIRRDQKRPNYVGEKVIKQMYNQFLKPTPPVIAYNPNLPDAILCDIDGTLALFGDANPYDRDFLQDILNQPVAHILRIQNVATFESLGSAKVILVSGRTDKFRAQTEQWISLNEVTYDELFMRKDGDVRKDVIIKQEIYEVEIKDKYNVLFVLDDRDQVVDFWRSQGLTCLQVNYGDF